MEDRLVLDSHRGRLQRQAAFDRQNECLSTRQSELGVSMQLYLALLRGGASSDRSGADGRAP